MNEKDITANGVEVYYGNGYELSQLNTSTMPDEKEINSCREFLKDISKLKRINNKFSSYALKHRVERYLKRKGIKNTYVTNGAFIVAAIREGFKVERENLSSPNTYFNISTLDLRRKENGK